MEMSAKSVAATRHPAHITRQRTALLLSKGGPSRASAVVLGRQWVGCVCTERVHLISTTYQWKGEVKVLSKSKTGAAAAAAVSRLCVCGSVGGSGGGSV